MAKGKREISRVTVEEAREAALDVRLHDALKSRSRRLADKHLGFTWDEQGYRTVGEVADRIAARARTEAAAGSADALVEEVAILLAEWDGGMDEGRALGWSLRELHSPLRGLDAKGERRWKRQRSLLHEEAVCRTAPASLVSHHSYREPIEGKLGVTRLVTDYRRVMADDPRADLAVSKVSERINAEVNRVGHARLRAGYTVDTHAYLNHPLESAEEVAERRPRTSVTA